jgi:hypothetical protein
MVVLLVQSHAFGSVGMESHQSAHQASHVESTEGEWVSDGAIRLLSNGGARVAVVCDFLKGHQLQRAGPPLDVFKHDALRLSLSVDASRKLSGVVKFISLVPRCNQKGYSMVEDSVAIKHGITEGNAFVFETSPGVRWLGESIDSNSLQVRRMSVSKSATGQVEYLRLHRFDRRPMTSLKVRTTLEQGRLVPSRTVPLALTVLSKQAEQVLGMKGIFALAVPPGAITAYVSDFDLTVPAGEYRISVNPENTRFVVLCMRAAGVELLM